MTVDEIDYSGIRHTLDNPDALEPAFDGRELRDAILALLPAGATWEAESPEPADDGLNRYGVSYEDYFMPIFWWDDGNTVEFEPGSPWESTVRAILKLMQQAVDSNAAALGESNPPQLVEPEYEPEEVGVYELDPSWLETLK